MESNYNDLPPMIYPYHMGPKVRKFSTSLLFHGKLGVSIAAWPMGDPIDAFISVGDWANGKKHPLVGLFSYVYHYFDLAQEHAVAEMKHFAPLGDKISRALTIYPGTPEHYDIWEPYHKSCLPLALKAINNEAILATVSTDFIFRVYELMIIFDNNPEKVLTHLSERTKYLGQEKFLLAECALNRYTLPKTGNGQWITDSEEMLNILSIVGKSSSIELDLNGHMIEGLSSTLFDKILKPYIPDLDGVGINIINKMMTEKSDELLILKQKVSREAFIIVNESPSERMLKSAFEASLITMEKEVSSIVEINKNSFKDLTKKLLEDRVVWSTFAGFVGAATNGMPMSVTAALGITALSSVGSTAVKIRNEEKKKLKESPYSFIHYLASNA